MLCLLQLFYCAIPQEINYSPTGFPGSVFLILMKFKTLSNCFSQASLVVAHRLSTFCTQTQLSHGMWELSSLTRDRTLVPYIGRQVLNHWTTRDIPKQLFLEVWQSHNCTAYFQRINKLLFKQVRRGGLCIIYMNTYLSKHFSKNVKFI